MNVITSPNISENVNSAVKLCESPACHIYKVCLSVISEMLLNWYLAFYVNWECISVPWKGQWSQLKTPSHIILNYVIISVLNAVWGNLEMLC